MVEPSARMQASEDLNPLDEVSLLSKSARPAAALPPSASGLNLDFQLLFHSFPGTLTVLLPNDPVFTIAAVNQTYVKVSGIPADLLVGHGVFEMFPDNPDLPQASSTDNLRASFRRVIATLAPDELPFERYDVRRSFGQDAGFEERYWRAVNSPILDAHGRLQYILHAAEEITERVLAERRAQNAGRDLTLSETRFRQLVEASTFGLFIADLDGQISYINPALSALLGYSREAGVEGLLDFAQLTPPEFAPSTAAAFRALRAAGHASPFESAFRARDGRLVPVLVGASVLGAPGQYREAAFFVLDLTGRKRSERDAFLLALDETTRPLADPAQIMRAAARLLRLHLNTDTCKYACLDEDGEHLSVIGDRAVPETVTPEVDQNAPIPEVHRLSDMGAHVAALLRSGQPLVLADSETDPRVSADLAFYRELQLRAIVCAPLLKDGVLVAVLCVEQATTREWWPEDVELVGVVANRCWESIERARVTRNLAAGEQRLRLAQRAARIGSFEWLVSEDRIIWSGELESLYGLPEGAFEGRLEDWSKRVVPEDAARVLSALEECLARRQPECVFDFRAVLPDGRQRWLRSQAQISYDDAGETVRLIGVNIDIDAQKTAEAELEQQWHTFDIALSHTPDFTYIFGLDGRFVYANRALLSLLDQPLEAVRGRNFLDLGYPPDLAARLQRQIQQVIATRLPVRDQTPFTGASGISRYYEYIFVPVLSETGEVEAVSGSTRDVTDRMETEQLLEKDRRRWRELLLGAPAAIAVLRGPEHRFEWFNDAYLRLTGRSSSEALIGRSVRDALPEIEGQVYIDLLDRVFHTGQPYSGHESLVRLDRGSGPLTAVYLNFVYIPTHNSEGEVDGVFVHATDVTDLVAARKRIELSERIFRTLVESAKDHAIIGLDLEARVITWNSGAERLLGYQEKEILGQSGAVIFTPEDRARHADKIELANAASTHQVTDERWHLRKDGTRFWGSGTVTPLMDDSETMVGFVKVFQDRTSERASRRALLESEERFRQLANSMPQMVWASGPDGVVDYYNERWYEFTGFDRGLSGDASWTPSLHPEDRKRTLDAWNGCVVSGRPYSIEYRLWDLHEQRWRWFMGRALPVRDENNQITRWFGTCTDIDEQKTTQQALLQSHKIESLGLLVGYIAHDFNNLLVSMMAGASELLESAPEEHPSHAVLESIVQSSELAAQLTRQLMAYAGKGQFQIAPIDFSLLVGQTLDLVSASIPKSVQVRLELHRHLPCVYSDASQMKQVVMNLILNASDAIGSERNGFVTARTRPEDIAPDADRRDVLGNSIAAGLYVIFEVSDTGSGIDAVTLTKIFDPFFTTKFTGRGLGLAAVRAIVRSYQGAIEVDTVPGQGSTFRVLLPARYAEPAPAVPPTPDEMPTGSGRETILIIDDEPMVRQVARLALERAGYRPVVAAGGVKGLEVIRENPEIALVILDMSMPEMSGRQVLESLQTIRPGLPVVICSGYSEDEVDRQFLGLETAGTLQKPFTGSRLASKIRSVLDHV